MRMRRFAILSVVVAMVFPMPGGMQAALSAPPANPTAFDCGTVSEVPRGECEALVALYNSTDGANWDDKSGWLVTNTPCSWHGVTCADGHVIQLNLYGNQLNGSIPPALGNLTSLKYLYLYDNQLSGSIPPALGNLANLEQLNLYGNQLNGSIPPELGNLANLLYLYLSSNQLSGSIPPELGNLANLEQLYLSGNPLTGPLPQSLTNLTLSWFSFQGTNLCEPPNAAYQAWLTGIGNLNRTGTICDWQTFYLPMVLR